ncbi:MAG: Ig-like domain-containing protein, partial [Calditrichaeota bacterium]|nr:Ig-like domain-containing protein [Calditrichota bacterium]
SDVNAENEFNLDHIKSGDYLHFFFNDKNRDFKYDMDAEEIAFSVADLKINGNYRRNYRLNFMKIDTNPPLIQKLDTLERGLVSLKFDEELDLKQSQFYFSDSLGKEIPIHLIGSGTDYIGFHSVDSLHFPLRLNYRKIADRFGNSDDSLRLDYTIQMFADRDSTQFKFISMSPKSETDMSSLKPQFTLKFSKAVEWRNEFRTDIQMRNQSNQAVDLNFKQVSKNEISFEPRKSLTVSENYTVELQFKRLHSIYREFLKDTVYHYFYNGIPRNRFGSISFELRHPRYQKAMVKVIDLEGNKIILEEEVTTNRETIIEPVSSGRYVLDFYIDLNENKVYDSGFIKPFRYAEPYYFYADTIPVRGGWENNRERINLND